MHFRYPLRSPRKTDFHSGQEGTPVGCCFRWAGHKQLTINPTCAKDTWEIGGDSFKSHNTLYLFAVRYRQTSCVRAYINTHDYIHSTYGSREPHVTWQVGSHRWWWLWLWVTKQRHESQGLYLSQLVVLFVDNDSEEMWIRGSPKGQWWNISCMDFGLTFCTLWTSKIAISFFLACS